MIETLKNLIDRYHEGLLGTPNIQVIEKTFSDEVISFPYELIADGTFDSSTFKNSRLINMKFINVNFESSFFDKCFLENCVFKNCLLINCKLSESGFTETIFKECTFAAGSLGNAMFESCHFIKTMFKDL